MCLARFSLVTGDFCYFYVSCLGTEKLPCGFIWRTQDEWQHAEIYLWYGEQRHLVTGGLFPNSQGPVAQTTTWGPQNLTGQGVGHCIRKCRRHTLQSQSPSVLLVSARASQAYWQDTGHTHRKEGCWTLKSLRDTHGCAYTHRPPTSAFSAVCKMPGGSVIK